MADWHLVVAPRLDSTQALDPMMRRTAPVAALLILASQPTLASQTACVFSGDAAPQYYELEFIGYGDPNPMIVFSSTAFASGQRVTLHPADYTLKQFNQKAAMVSLEFRNPGGRALPPSFSLVGRSGHARLKIGATVVEGTLRCDVEYPKAP